ncbi:MAG: hypothetical protein F6K24_20165 [Okeania sp. SIO2D1]|nr:hypothetical protein [Okeania sp. SIO2D1]
MNDHKPGGKAATLDKESIGALISGLGNELSLIKSCRNYRAWEIYKDIVARSGVHHNYRGLPEQQGGLEVIATFALSAAECFENAAEDYDS